jgi:hypothetical protein
VNLYRHRADELNKLGANPAFGTLASHELGDEIQFMARWRMCPNMRVLGIVSAAFPEKVIEAAASGDSNPWTTLQAQFFWGF